VKRVPNFRMLLYASFWVKDAVYYEALSYRPTIFSFLSLSAFTRTVIFRAKFNVAYIQILRAIIPSHYGLFLYIIIYLYIFIYYIFGRVEYHQ
jgi:hypothetical protein